MGVVPSKIELTLDRGESEDVPLIIPNNSPTPLKVSFSTWDFARDERGIPYPIGPKDVKTFRGCGSWVTFASKKIHVDTGKAGKAVFTVTVPPDAEFGTYYTYIKAFGAPSPLKKAGVAINYIINALLLVTVGRKGGVPVLKRSAYLKSFFVKRFNFTSPVLFTTKISNTGNVHLNLTGKIQIKKGKVIMETIPIKESTLLPMNTFPIIKAWGNPPLFGKFKAEFTGNVGLDKPLTDQKTFWVISWKLIVGILGLFVLLIFRKSWKKIKTRLASRRNLPG